MSVELERDLRTYMSYLDTVLPTILADDIVEPKAALAPVPPPRRRGWVVAAVALVALLGWMQVAVAQLSDDGDGDSEQRAAERARCLNNIAGVCYRLGKIDEAISYSMTFIKTIVCKFIYGIKYLF